NFGLEVLGIPGTNGPDIRQSGIPLFASSRYLQLSKPHTRLSLFLQYESFTRTINFKSVRGQTSRGWGFDRTLQHLNHRQPERGGGPRGLFSFGGGVTALIGGPSPNQFNAYASFVLGLPNSMEKSLQHILMTGREWQFAWYFRDRWQATRHLT